MGYYRERTAIFMGPMDWFIVGVCLVAAVIGAFAGGGGLMVTIFAPLLALLVWWLNVAPTTPRPQQGEDD